MCRNVLGIDTDAAEPDANAEKGRGGAPLYRPASESAGQSMRGFHFKKAFIKSGEASTTARFVRARQGTDLVGCCYAESRQHLTVIDPTGHVLQARNKWRSSTLHLRCNLPTVFTRWLFDAPGRSMQLVLNDKNLCHSQELESTAALTSCRFSAASHPASQV